MAHAGCDNCVLKLIIDNVGDVTETLHRTEEEVVFKDCVETVLYDTDEWIFEKQGDTYKEVAVAPKQPILQQTTVQPVIVHHVTKKFVDNPTIEWIETKKKHTEKIPGNQFVQVVKDPATATPEYRESTKYLKAQYRSCDCPGGCSRCDPAAHPTRDIELTPQPPTPGSNSHEVFQRIRVVHQAESPEARVAHPSPVRPAGHNYRQGEQVSLDYPPGTTGHITAATTPEKVSIALGNGTNVDYYSPFIGIHRPHQASPGQPQVIHHSAPAFLGEPQVARVLTYR